ncbi:MAG: hypothetical protein JO076_05055 [Verrucomicrobia bacterium]|nr:hypothetical protein [Verrucomicrobiota bacterium]
MSDNQESRRRQALISVILRAIQEDPILYGSYRESANNRNGDAANGDAASADAAGGADNHFLSPKQGGACNAFSNQLRVYFERKIQTRESAIKLSRVNWDVITDWILAESRRERSTFAPDALSR